MEALLALPALTAAGAIILILLYRSAIYFLADFHLHEAMICSEHDAIPRCEMQLKILMKKCLVLKESFQVSIHANGFQTHGKIKIEMTPPLVIEKKLNKSYL